MTDKLISLIPNLEQAKGHSTWLDEEIATQIGYRKASDNPPVWISPDGSRFPRAPYFTVSLDRAYEFSQAILPSGVVAVAEAGDGVPRAVADDGPQCFGANKAIAVMLAVLKARYGHTN